MNCVSVTVFSCWFFHFLFQVVVWALGFWFCITCSCGFYSFCWFNIASFLTSLIGFWAFQATSCSSSQSILVIFSFLCFTSFFQVLRAHFAACPPTGFIHVAGLTLHFFVTSLLGSLVFRAIVCFSMSIFCYSLLLSLCSISLLEPLCSHFVAVSTKGFTHETVRTLHFFSRRALPP